MLSLMILVQQDSVSALREQAWRPRCSRREGPWYRCRTDPKRLQHGRQNPFCGHSLTDSEGMMNEIHTIKVIQTGQVVGGVLGCHSSGCGEKKVTVVWARIN